MKLLLLSLILCLSGCLASDGFLTSQMKLKKLRSIFENDPKTPIDNLVLTFDERSILESISDAMIRDDMAYFSWIVTGLQSAPRLLEHARDRTRLCLACLECDIFWAVDLILNLSPKSEALIKSAAKEAIRTGKISGLKGSVLCYPYLSDILDVGLYAIEYGDAFVTYLSKIIERGALVSLNSDQAIALHSAVMKTGNYRSQKFVSMHPSIFKLFEAEKSYSSHAMSYFTEFKDDQEMLSILWVNIRAISIRESQDLALETFIHFSHDYSIKNIEWLGSVIKEAKIEHQALALLPRKFKRLIPSLYLDVPLFIENAVHKPKSLEKADFRVIWKTQAPGLIHAFQLLPFIKWFSERLAQMCDISRAHLLSYGFYDSIGSNFLTIPRIQKTSKEYNNPMVQDIHRALIVAYPEILLSTNDDCQGFDFFYDHGSTLFDCLAVVQPHTINKFLRAAYCSCGVSNRLAKAVGSILKRDEMKDLVLFAIENEEYDIAYAALRNYHYILKESETVPGLQPECFHHSAILAIKPGKWDSAQFELDQDELPFCDLLVNSILPSLQSGFKPFAEFVVCHFRIEPQRLLKMPGLEPYYDILGNAIIFDGLHQISDEDGNIIVSLVLAMKMGGERRTKKLNRLIPYLNSMNPIRIILAFRALRKLNDE